MDKGSSRRRSMMLAGVSLLALGIPLVSGRTAWADCGTYSGTDNTISSSCSGAGVGWGAGNLTVTSGTSLSATDQGVTNTFDSNSYAVGTLVNNGAISGNATGGVDIYSTSAQAIINNGVIGGTRASAILNGNSGTIGSITNADLITGSYGIYDYSSSSIGNVTNSGTITGSVAAISVDSSSSIGVLTNSGVIAGNIVNNSSNALTIDGGGTTVGTLTGYTAGSQGTITNTAANLVFASGNILLNDAINVGSQTVSNSGAALSITSSVSITGNYAQTAGTLSVGDSGELEVSGTAALSGTVSLSGSGNYLAGTGATLVSAAGGLSTSALTISGPTGLAYTSSITASALAASYQNDYIGGSLSSLTNSGSIGAAYGVYVAATGSLGSLANSGTISGSSYAVDNNGGSLGTLTNSGAIAGNIVNASANALTIDGGSGTTVGTLTGYTAGSQGTITNTTANLVFSAGNILLNDAINVGSRTVSNAGAVLSLSTIVSVTGNYAQTAGTLSLGGSGELVVSGSASLTGGTVTGSLSGSGNYLAGSGTTLISAAGGVSTSGLSVAITSPTGLAVSTVNTGTALTESDQNDYIGGSLSSLTNSGSIGAAYGVYVAATGSLGGLANSGTISGSSYAIDNAGGRLGTLSNSGVIAGNILNLSATPLTIAGAGDGSFGTLTGYAAGSAGTITNTAANLVFASGNILLNDDINVGSYALINAGATVKLANARTITGNYLQTGGGLVIGVASASSYGSLTVSGTATVTNSTITISGTGLASGETLTIVRAGGTGSYSGDSSTISGTSGLVATLSTVGNTLIVTLTGDSSLDDTGSTSTSTTTTTTTTATTPRYAQLGAPIGPTGATMGAALDRSLASGSASLSQILATIDSLPSAAKPAAIAQLAPSQVTPQIQIANLALNQVAGIVEQHQQAAAGDPDAVLGRAAGSDDRNKAIWGQMLGGAARRDNTNGTDGYRNSTFGLVLGADHQITSDLLTGIALSWVRGNAQGQDRAAGSSTRLDNYQLTAYGIYRQNAAFVDGQLGFGYNRYNQSRNLDAYGSAAQARFDGRQYLAKLTTGYDVPIEDVILTPLAGLQWVRAVNDRYTESGAGQADLTVDGRGINALSSELGGKLAITTETGWGALTHDAKLTWGHDYTQAPITTTGIIGGGAFATTAERMTPNAAKLTLGATLERQDGLSWRLEYDGEFRPDYQSQAGMIRVRMEF